MKVFITGASGRIGRHIIPHLQSRGHAVTGLVRKQASADLIKSLGATVTPVLGSLTDTDLLIANAKTHDAVIHCAMDHSAADRNAAAQQERDIVELFGNALEGTNKVFIMSSGTGFLANGGDEKTLPEPGKNPRGDTERVALGFKDRGIRSVSVRLAMNTHSPDEMHLFEGFLLKAADQLGYIPWYGDIRWSACHADDAGLLYVLALEKAEPGIAVHSFSELLKVKDIAEELAKRTGLKAGEIQKEKLGELGWLSILLQMDQNVSNEWTKKTFGWNPTGETLFEEFAKADKSYFGV